MKERESNCVASQVFCHSDVSFGNLVTEILEFVTKNILC